MNLLNKNSYDLVTGPLKHVGINNLFARSVVEKKVPGKVYVDNTECPRTFYVVHPYGMSLLFGDPANMMFNLQFFDYSLNKTGERDKHEWMQTCRGDWNKVLVDLYGSYLIKSSENKKNIETEIIELNTRLNFKFNEEKYKASKRDILPGDCEIVLTGEAIFKEMTGSVIPSVFWNTADDFIENGMGYSLICNNKLASTAYSAFIHDDKLELGIETVPDFRGRGFAQLTCSALIDYCIENNYEPVWACRLENTGSVRLAEKLGFEVCDEIPYYRLGK